MSADEALSKMRIPDYKDTADYKKFMLIVTLMPNQTTYLDASGYNEAFQEWKMQLQTEKRMSPQSLTKKNILRKQHIRKISMTGVRKHLRFLIFARSGKNSNKIYQRYIE